MIKSRIVFVVAVAVLPIAGCGDGCGRRNAAERAPDARPGVAASAKPESTAATTPRGPYELRRDIEWKVGDVVTSTGTTRTTGRVVRLSPDGRKTPMVDLTDTIRATWTEKVAEVDADGRRTRSVVNLNGWSRRRGRDVDATIEGTSFTVGGDGASRAWSFVAKKMEPSREATEWLDERFGRRGIPDEEWLRVMLPEERTPVGGTVHPDAARLADALAASGLPVDRTGVSASVTLVAVEGATARCAFHAIVPLLRVPNSDVPWTRGGSLTVEGTMAVPLEPAPFVLAELERTGTMKGEAEQDGATLQYDFVIHERRTTTFGGTLPPGAPAR